MPLFQYNTSVPNGPNNPSADQPVMQNNTLQTKNNIDLAHFTFNLANGGLHRQFNLRSEASPALQGNLVLYANTSGGQTVLFAKNSSYDLPLFTGTPGNAINGNSSIIGGVILQWGQVAAPGASGSVVFPIAFPSGTAPFTIQVSLQRASGNQSVTVDSAIPPTSTGFNYLSSSGGSAVLYWFAIGA